MARTKRQVLLNAARKQRQHGLMREAAGISDTPQSLNHGHDKNALYKTKPVPNKAESVKRDLQKSFGTDEKPDVCINESLKEPIESEKIETVTSSSCYPEKKVPKRRQQDSSYSPSLGSIRQLKLTARKSTHCEKKAEAEQIIAALMNSPNKTPTCSLQTACPWNFSSSKQSDDLSPAGPLSCSTPAKNTARKSMPGPSRSVFASKQRARKSISEYSSGFCPQVWSDSGDDDTESDSFYLKIFPSVHEAVLTLPKCETLPVAVVCINDVMRSPNSPSVSGVVDQTKKCNPQRCDKPLASPHKLSSSPNDESSPAESLKPAAKIKAKHVQKNIFDRFESEIRRSPKGSKSRTSIGGLKLGSSRTHSPDGKTSSVSKRSTGKANAHDAQISSHSPRKESDESPSICSFSLKGDHSSLEKTENKKCSISSEKKTRRNDIRHAFEKVMRSQSSSPRCDSSSVVDDKSPRRRSPRRTAVEKDGAVLSLHGSEDEALKVDSITSPTTSGSVTQIQSPDKSSQGTSRDREEENEIMCEDSTKSKDKSNIQSGSCRNKTKLSPSRSKKSIVNSPRTPKELKVTHQSVIENSDAENKKCAYKDKCDRDVDKLKISANTSCDGVKKCGNLLDLISRVGSRLQDSSSVEFLNNLPDSHESQDNDSSSSLSVTTSDAVEAESFDTSLEIGSPTSVMSDDQTANRSLSDSFSSKNSSANEQCLRKSPRRKVSPDECNKTKCDSLEAGCSKTESSSLQTSDDSVSQVSDSKKLNSCNQFAAVEVDCDKDKTHMLNTTDMKLENDTDRIIKSLNKKSFQQHEANDSSSEGAFLADAKIEKEEESPKSNLRSSEKAESCPTDSLAGSTESKLHRWAGSSKTVEPSSLEVLCKPEKNTVDKRSAFVSDDLENFLSSVKNDSVKVEQTDVKSELADLSDSQDIEDKNLEALEPDFDEIEGVLFLSFANEDALKAHIAVEKKNHWDKDSNYFWGISRYKAFEKLRSENKTFEKTHTLRNLRGKHMKWKKYRRLLRRELIVLKRNQLQASVKGSLKIPSKTSDITKIKGWKKKYGGRNHFKSNIGLNVYGSGKIHWRTEARLLRNMKADDIKALGIAIKKKRRKNVIFTNRKRSTKEFENRTDDPKDVNDQQYDDDDDGDDVVLGEVEDTVLSSGHSSRGSDCEYIYESDHALEDASEFKRLGVVKSTFIRKDFVNQFNWDEKDEQIHKKLGGRVRNRHKKNDPRDMRDLLEKYGESNVPVSPEVTDVPKKKKRQKFIPFVVLTKEMVKEAVKALFGEAVKPKKKKKCKKLKKCVSKSNTISEHDAKAGKVSVDCPVKAVDAVESSGSKSRHRSGDECDKPGHMSKPCSESCRYGCICHLCSSAEEADDSDVRRVDPAQVCDKEYCRLGCICDSLNNHSVSTPTPHCRKQQCQSTCMCTQDSTAAAMYEDGEGTNFEDLPPNLDKLDSMDRKTSDNTSDETSDRKKRSKKKKVDVELEYMPSEESMKKVTPGSEEVKKKTRVPRGDRFGNLPRRESMHRTSKNLDAVTRKAMMLYEMSEIYWEAGERKRRADTCESKSSHKSGATSTLHTGDVNQSSSSANNNNSNEDKHMTESTSTAAASSKSKTKSSVNENKIAKLSTRKTRNDSGGEVSDARCWSRSAVTDSSKDGPAETDQLTSNNNLIESHDSGSTMSVNQKHKTKSGTSHVKESKQQTLIDKTKELVTAASLTDDSKDDPANVDELPSSTSHSAEDCFSGSNIKTESSDLSKDSVEIIEKSPEEPILISGDESDADDDTVSNSNSRRSSESVDSKAEVLSPLWNESNVIDKIKKLTEDLKQKKNELKMRNTLQQQLVNPVRPKPPVKPYLKDSLYDRRVSQWHTQMVCLKANPKPSTDGSGDSSQEDEIKLLEFIANCNWDNAKSQVLSRVAQCLNRGVYPNPKKMVVSDYIVEILPKADRPACIPPELRAKLPDTMFSIRVKVTKKSDPVDFPQMKVLASRSSLVQQQLQKSKSLMSKIWCDSASNRVFNKMNYKNKDFPVSVKVPVFTPTYPGKPVSAPVVSTANQLSKPDDLSKDGLVLAHKQTENTVGISGLSKLKISQSDLSEVSSTVSQGKTVKLGSHRKKKKMPIESDDLGQIVIENAETGAMKPLLYGYKNDCSERKASMIKSPNKRKRKQDIAFTKTSASTEGNKTDDDDDSVLTECDDSQCSEIVEDCSDNGDHIQSKALKSGVGKNYVIENGSIVENKNIAATMVMGTNHPTASVDDVTAQTLNVPGKPVGPACKTAKHQFNIQPGKKPLLLPAPLKAGQILGPFSNLSDLKFITLPGGKDQTQTFLQLVPTSGKVSGQSQQMNGSKANYHPADYIAIPVTFKDDKLQSTLNTFSVSACNGVKTKTLNSEEITSSCSAIADNTDSKNPASGAAQSDSLPTDQPTKDSNKLSKKRSTKKRKLQEVRIEKTNQIVYVKTCVPAEKKVKKKRAIVKVTQELLDDYADTIARVAAVGKADGAGEPVDGGSCPADAAPSFVTAVHSEAAGVEGSTLSSQSALAALLLTSHIPSTSSSKLEDSNSCSDLSHETAVAEGDDSVNQVRTDSSLSVAGESQSKGNVCPSETWGKTQSDESKDCVNTCPETADDVAVVSSSDSIHPCSDGEVPDEEAVLRQHDTASNPETVISTISDVENVDPKDKESCSENISDTNILTHGSDWSAKRRFSENDISVSATAAKKSKPNINSSSDKLYDLIVNKVAGFPFPEDSDSENSMSIARESLDDCCERLSMQITCEDGLDITQVASPVGLSAAPSLLHHQLSDSSSPLQGKHPSPKTQISRTLQATDVSEHRLNKQLTESLARSDSPLPSLLKPKCSLELAKMLLGDINQNFKRQQRRVTENGTDGSREQTPVPSGKNSSCSSLQNAWTTNVQKTPTQNVAIANLNNREKPVEVIAESASIDGSAVLGNELSLVKTIANHCLAAAGQHISMQISEHSDFTKE